MGLLVGLPLKIFYMLFTVLRFAWPLVIVLAVALIRRRLRGGSAGAGRNGRSEAERSDPVVEVDYEVVDEQEPDEETP